MGFSWPYLYYILLTDLWMLQAFVKFNAYNIFIFPIEIMFLQRRNYIYIICSFHTNYFREESLVRMHILWRVKYFEYANCLIFKEDCAVLYNMTLPVYISYTHRWGAGGANFVQFDIEPSTSTVFILCNQIGSEVLFLLSTCHYIILTKLRLYPDCYTFIALQKLLFLSHVFIIVFSVTEV